MQRRLASVALILVHVAVLHAGDPWRRHTIDRSFRGADGVRLADFNDDGLPDVVTGWEQSGVVRLYLNPGPEAAIIRWSAVTVGRAASPEDAVPVDVNGDGMMDVVSCHEGKARKVLVHLNRSTKRVNDDLLSEANWETAEFAQVAGQSWMFAAPIRLREGREAIVLGSKGSGASITLLMAPEKHGGKLDQWQAIRLRDAGWIMSLRVIDIDGDGHDDIVFSDRKGNHRGVGWLRQPKQQDGQWVEETIGGQQYEVMFLELMPRIPRFTDRPEVYVSTRNSLWFGSRWDGNQWRSEEFENPPDVGNGKAIARLGDSGFVMTANVNGVPGIWHFHRGQWNAIGSKAGGKYDRIEVLDLNGDGALDVMTCEERRNLGVIWYENPGGKQDE